MFFAHEEMVLKTSSRSSFNASKIRPIIAIIFTTFISVVLIVGHDIKYIGRFRDAVLGSPGAASFVKQLLASLLGILWVYVASSVFSFTTRLR